jgi:hypothetical protein
MSQVEGFYIKSFFHPVYLVMFLVMCDASIITVFFGKSLKVSVDGA